MNAVEIEEAVSALAERPFDAAEFPFALLEAFGNKATTIKRLRTGASNRLDVTGPWGGVLQTNNIHIAVAAPGAVTETLGRLKASPATAKAKAKFVLATDGDTFEAEDVESGETVACDYAAFPDHFGFFLPLAGITTVRHGCCPDPSADPRSGCQYARPLSHRRCGSHHRQEPPARRSCDRRAWDQASSRCPRSRRYRARRTPCSQPASGSDRRGWRAIGKDLLQASVNLIASQHRHHGATCP